MPALEHTLERTNDRPENSRDGDTPSGNAIGAETTGWLIQLDQGIDVDGKHLDAIQVSDSRKPGSLENLADKHVRAAGRIAHRTGVETGSQPFLEISSIREAKAVSAAAEPVTLPGTSWRLDDLGGTAVIDNSKATLIFGDAGKISGNGSCNRFFGTVENNGNQIKLGPLGSTRMACPEAVMHQETKYLEALQAADRFEWKEPYLLVYGKSRPAPLRFTKEPAR